MTTDIPIENLLPKSNYSMYSLVSMAAARALELSDGKRCLIENPSSEKLTTRALEEILQGKIETKEAYDIRIASEKAKKG